MNPTEKTSDLRQNNTFLTPGTRESHKLYKTYTNDDLCKQIKSRKVSHIIFKLGNFIKNNNGKKIIEIPLNLLPINNIESIKILNNELYDLKKNNVINKYYILSNQFGYLIDGEFNFDKNLIPNNLVIPLNLSVFCTLNLYIPLTINGNINQITNEFIRDLYFEIEYGETIFYKSFQEDLINENDYFLIQEFNSKSLLFDSNQKNFITQKNNDIIENNLEEESDNIICIDNVEYNINKIEIGELIGYEFAYTPNICKPNFLYALVKKRCDFIKSTFAYSAGLANVDNFTKTNLFTHKISDNCYNHKLHINFVRYCDTISNIIFAPNFGNIFNFNKIKLSISINGHTHLENYNLTLKEKSVKDSKGTLKVLYIEELENKHLNILHNYGITLKFHYESNIMSNMLEYLYFMYDIYFLDTPIRRKYAKDGNFIDISTLSLYKLNQSD